VRCRGLCGEWEFAAKFRFLGILSASRQIVRFLVQNPKKHFENKICYNIKTFCVSDQKRGFLAETIQLENALTSGRSRRFPAETIQLENALTAGRSRKFQAETNQLQNARNAGRPLQRKRFPAETRLPNFWQATNKKEIFGTNNSIKKCLNCWQVTFFFLCMRSSVASSESRNFPCFESLEASNVMTFVGS
jgi:hypothetical protein